MPLEETAAGSRRAALSYSPSRSPASSRIYGAAGASSSQRRTAQGAFSMRPPEPLRRAVADCLSSSASSSSAVAVSGAPHVLQGYPSGNASDATRLLRDYIASPSTTDMAYSVLVEHALAERDRSPAVVPKCVALLKRYLMRYVPGLQILRQIDLFCVNLIVECESVTSQSVSLRSSSLSQQYGTSLSSTALLPSPLASNYASPSLVKSLNYVRSLVARHTPMLSFQPSAIEASTALKQSLPSLSSLLSRSFSSQLGTEVSGRTSLKLKEDSIPSTSKISSLEEVNTREGNKYIFFDLLKWRWPGNKEYQTALLRESNSLRLEDVHNYGFLETGAATLLIADLESKVKSQPSKYRADDIPDIGLLQPSMATMATDYTSADSHLKAITAAKRMKLGPQQVWANIPVSTFYPRARPLFQYRHYSEQQPLKLNFAEIREVIAEVCSESSSHITSQLSTPKIIGNSGQPASDVAASVLIKLVIDMYVMDRGTAAPLTLYMLEGMISSGRALSRARAFDFILNLGIHAQLLEPMLPEDPPHESLQETDLNSEEQLSTTKKVNTESNIQERIASAIDKFESWILVILYEMLILLVQTEEREEIVWASALSCLFFFVCDRGQILRNRLDGLDIRVVKTLLEVSREHSWAEIIHCKLICMLTNMFYQSSEGPGIALSETPTFVSKQVDLLGGIDFICLEYSRANTREEKHNLFLVLLDYVSYQINESCLANEASGYDDDEIQTIVSMLIRAGAPGAFYISVKSGLEGIGDIFKKSISSTLLRFPNCDNLKLLLEKITGKLDSTLSAFTRLDHEFSYMIRVTKSVKSFPRINNKVGEADDLMEAKLSFATLHSLLHSERSAYRHHGYIWLVELILSEINDNRNGSIWSSMTNFQQQILVAGSQDSPYLEVPFSISMMCGLLKSKSNFIRWGFLYVLEKVLIRCKLFLDESDLQYLDPEGVVNRKADIQIDKANAIIDIMNAALSLVVQMNETDHINILKMCEILFTQLCFKLQSSPEVPFEDFKISHLFDCASESCRYEHEAHFSVEATERKSLQGDKLPESVQIHHGTDQSNTICETASMAALLLRGQAIAPTQLATRVPASLFYWPLIQLAGAATDDIALGVAVGSKGRGNLPGATSDIRAALLLLLIGKCTADPEAFMEIEGKEFFRGLLDDTDSRVAYYSAAFLLKRMMSEEPETYQRMLQNLIFKAQQCNNEKLLENPYLQMRGILQLSNDIGAQI